LLEAAEADGMVTKHQKQTHQVVLAAEETVEVVMQTTLVVMVKTVQLILAAEAEGLRQPHLITM
jgi:hypothetical protein